MKRFADVLCNAHLAAAHERCLAMMLSQKSGGKGGTVGKVKFAAHLTLGNIPAHGWTITHSHLVLAGNAPKIKAAVPGGPVADSKGISISGALDVPVMLGTSIF